MATWDTKHDHAGIILRLHKKEKEVETLWQLFSLTLKPMKHRIEPEREREGGIRIQNVEKTLAELAVVSLPEIRALDCISTE